MPASPSLLTPDFMQHARRLNDLQYRESARRFYEVMSGAILWEDEQAQLPFSEIGWFRCALAYRSSVILGAPRTEFESIWRALHEIAPDWPGFRKERSEAGGELARFLQESKKKSAREIDRLDAATRGDWSPLLGKEKNG